MFQIDIMNEKNYPVDPISLQQAALTVLQGQSERLEGSLTVVIEDDEAVAALNSRYRGIDSATDVLSFPSEMPMMPIEMMDEDALPYLGDLIIAYPYALAQAQREGHDAMQSFSLLVVHGTLHLLGYDHDTLENRAEMWAAQETALMALGISTAIVPSLEGSIDDH